MPLLKADFRPAGLLSFAEPPDAEKLCSDVTFLVEGALRFDEAGVLMTFEERPEDITDNVGSLGYDLPGLISSKKLMIDQVKIERGESEESGEYDLEGLFVRLGSRHRHRRRQTSRPRHHRESFRRTVELDDPAK